MASQSIVVDLVANTGGFIKDLSKADKATEKFAITLEQTGKLAGFASAAIDQAAKAVRKIGGGLLTGGLGLGAGLALMTRGASQFQAKMLNVQSIAKLTEGELNELGDSVVEFSKGVTQSATELSEGLYDVISSGFNAAEANYIMEESAIAASAGLTTTQVAARATAAVLNAYGLEAYHAADVNDILFRTVDLGVITFEELANTMGDWVGTAAAVGVGADEASAAIAAMTRAGIGGAEASTSLNRLLQSFIDPVDELNAVAIDYGYTSALVMLRTEGLYQTMMKLGTATHGNIEEFNMLFPEIRAVRGGLALLANDGLNYADVANQITDSTARAGATQEAFDIQMSGTSAAAERFRNSLSALSIALGTELLPAVERVIKMMTFFVNMLGMIPGPVKTVISYITGFAAAVVVFVGATALFAAKAVVWRLIMAKLVGIFTTMSIITAGPVSAGFVKLATGARAAGHALGPFGAIAKGLTAGMAKLGIAIAGTTVGMVAGIAIVAAFGVALNQSAKAAEEAGRRAAKAFTEKIDVSNYDSVQDKIAQIANELERVVEAHQRNPISRLLGAFDNDYAKESGYIDELRLQLMSVSREADKAKDAFAGAFLQSTLGDSARVNLVTYFDENRKALSKWAAESGADEDIIMRRMKNIAEAYHIDLSQPRQDIINDISAIYSAMGQKPASAQELERSIADLAEAAEEAGDRFKELDDVLNQLFDQFVSSEKASDALYGTLNDLVGQVEELKYGEDTPDLSEAMDFSKTTEDAIDLRDTMLELVERNKAVVMAWARDQPDLTGHDVRLKLEEQATEIERQGEAAGLSTEFVQHYAEILRDMADEPEVFVAFNSNIETQEGALYEYLETFALIPEEVDTLVQVYEEDGMAGIERYLRQVGLIDDISPRTIVDLYAEEASDELITWAESLGLLPSEVETLLVATLTNPETLQEAADNFGLTDEQVKLFIEIVGEEDSESKIAVIEDYLARVSGENWEPTITVDDSSAQATINNLVRRLNALDSMRTSVATRIQEQIDAGIPAMTSTDYGGIGGFPRSTDADGSVKVFDTVFKNELIGNLEFNANGGIEDHVAQIADARTMRVWAEPETGGEAYIPLSKRKRVRSLAILAHVARMFGRKIVQNKDGSVVSPFGISDDELSFIAGTSTPPRVYPRPSKPETPEEEGDLSGTRGGSRGAAVATNTTETLDAELLKYEIMHSLNEIKNKEYIEYLDDRIKAETKYTREWWDLYQQRRGLLDDMEAESVAHERRLYATGMMGRNEYVRLLSTRLRDLKSFSDEWFDVWSEIDSIREDANQNYESANENLEGGITEHLENVREAYRQPIAELANAAGEFGQAAEITTDEVLQYYQHVATASERWQRALRGLGESNLNKTLVDQVARQGPDALTLAEALNEIVDRGMAQQVNESIERINQVSEEVASARIKPYAQDYASSLFTQDDIDFNTRYGISLDGIKQSILNLASGYGGLRSALGDVEVAALDLNAAMADIQEIDTAITVASGGINPVNRDVDPIDQLYAMLLERPADDAGADYWRGVYESGKTLDQIAGWMKQSEEYKNKSTIAKVTDLYEQVFSRLPDQAGLEYYTGLVNKGTTLSKLETYLQQSPEYMKIQSGEITPAPMDYGRYYNTTTATTQTFNIDVSGTNLSEAEVRNAVSDAIRELEYQTSVR